MQLNGFNRAKSAIASSEAIRGWLLFLAITAVQIGADSVVSNEPHCPSEEKCDNLNADCWYCNFPASCKYGEKVVVQCEAKPQYAQCQGDATFNVEAKCLYCYQTDPSSHVCDPVTNCSATAPPPENLVQTTCVVDGRVVCMGKRHFRKRVTCQWTSGRYKWSTALILSITLGGFGADRFYLGLWRSGLGKLFSFGGLGVWTIVDVVLIGVGYVGPADNSLYIY